VSRGTYERQRICDRQDDSSHPHSQHKKPSRKGRFFIIAVLFEIPIYSSIRAPKRLKNRLIPQFARNTAGFGFIAIAG
jgi:hypothetical protein